MNDTIYQKIPASPDLPAPPAGDKANSTASDKSEPLPARANLGTVDHESFSRANKDFGAAGSAAEHLPEVIMPLALDKDLSRAHDQLAAAADAAIADPAARKQFKADMDSFEKRAEESGLTAAQAESTYKQVQRMLGAAPESPLTAPQRLQAASQWMAHLADPEGTTRQGWHDTCAWTSMEVKLIITDPDKISEKMAELVTTGGVTTVDTKKMTELVEAAKNGGPQPDPDTVPTKFLKIDSASLQPDQEAQGLFHHGDDRSYVDQLAQVMMDNIRWDAQPYAPDGTMVGTGEMRYGQCEIISRPSDGLPAGAGRDASCESVTYIDPKTGQKVVDDGQGYGEGGGATPAHSTYVNGVITGRFEPMALVRTENGPEEDENTIVGVGSSEGLKNLLRVFQANKQLPFGAMVEVDHPGIREDYLARHPEKTAAMVPKDSWHFILVTGIDDKGNVQFYNPWGLKRTVTAEQLYEAMGKSK